MSSASATLHACNVSEKVLLAVRAAASAVVAHEIGLRFESISASDCSLPVRESNRGYSDPTDEDFKYAKVFFADSIAKQKLLGEPLVMKYELDNLPGVLKNAVSPIGDWFCSDELILCQLNALYLMTRDLLRGSATDDEWGNWGVVIEFADLLIESDGKGLWSIIPGRFAERWLDRRQDRRGEDFGEVCSRILGRAA